MYVMYMYVMYMYVRSHKTVNCGLKKPAKQAQELTLDIINDCKCK